MRSISVESSSNNFSSTGGVLFNKDKTELISYPGWLAGTYSIPNGVKSICPEAFYYCLGLTSITIPNSVTSIGFRAFQCCENLTNVTIPESVTSIEYDAFEYCSSLQSVVIPKSLKFISGCVFDGCLALTDVYYTGTQEEWNQVYVADNNEPLTSATIHFAPSLAITAQPASATVIEGNNATFKVVASGSNLTYQWQVCEAGSSTWSNSPATGNKTATLTVPATMSRNGYKYRCVVKSGSGSVTSNAATLTVTIVKPTITTQPKSLTVAVDSTATFTVAASGTGLSYQWQVSTDGGSSWSNSPATGNKTKTLTVPATADRSGYKYRCIVKNSGGSATSSAATLTVKAPKITAQPKSVTASAGSYVQFSVTATGLNLTYQWQVSTDGGKSWSNATAEGNKTAALTVPATASRSGYKYRCVVKSGTASVTSSAATLTVS
jgi:hypothetical protein